MMIMRCKTLLAAFLVAATIGGVFPSSAWADPVLRIYAAGSLKGVLGEAAGVFTAREGIAVKTSFGPSGTLRERLQAGEAADLFASADLGQPQALAALGLAEKPVTFAKSQVCALARAGLAMTPDNFLDTLLRKDIRVGTSTPKADPGGDYAWVLFHRAEELRPGSFALLDAKAEKLVGGPQSPEPPAGRPLWTYLMEQADVFLLYCNSAKAALEQVPGASIVQPPPELAVIPEYGASVLTHGDRPTAAKFLAFLQSQEGRTLLTKWGFSIP